MNIGVCGQLSAVGSDHKGWMHCGVAQGAEDLYWVQGLQPQGSSSCANHSMKLWEQRILSCCGMLPDPSISAGGGNVTSVLHKESVPGKLWGQEWRSEAAGLHGDEGPGGSGQVWCHIRALAPAGLEDASFSMVGDVYVGSTAASSPCLEFTKSPQLITLQDWGDDGS